MNKILPEILLVSGLLYSYYLLFLRNSRLHHFNRIYLLTILLVSIIIPFLHIPFSETFIAQTDIGDKTISGIISTANNIFPGIKVSDGKESFSLPGSILQIIYFAVCVIFVIRIFLVFKRIAKLLKKYPAEQRGDMIIVKTNEEDAPFSFYKWLFWNNRHDLYSMENRQVLAHEYGHVRQRHTIDIVLAELVFAVFWINPVFYFIKRELKVVHEFLADDSTTDKAGFAMHLVSQAIGKETKIAHNYFGSSVSRRIAMITGNYRNKNLYARVISCLVLLLLTLTFFSFENAGPKFATLPGKPEKALSIGEQKAHDEELIIAKNEIAKPIRSSSELFKSITAADLAINKRSIDTIPLIKLGDDNKKADEISLLNYRDNSTAHDISLPSDNRIPDFVTNRSDETQVLLEPGKNSSTHQIPIFYPAREYDELVLVFNKKGAVPLTDDWRLKVMIRDENGNFIAEKILSKEWITGYETARIVFHDLPKGNYHLQIQSSDKKYTTSCKVVKDYDDGVG